MSSLGDRSASFIIRIWREESDSPQAVVWRGSVEDIRSGNKAYFRELAMVERFLKVHMRDIGVDVD